MLKDTLRSLRESRGLSQSKIAELLNVSPAAYSTYEMGTRDVSSDKVVKLAQFYEVTTDYLYGIEDFSDNELSLKEKKHIKKYRSLDEYGIKAVDDLLNTEYERCTNFEETEEKTIEITFSELPVSAGTGQFLSDEMTSIIEIPDTPFNRMADFVVQVSGDSMEPDFSDEDLILVRKQPSVYEGEIGIFVVDGCGYVKKFGGNKLISINPDYDDIIFNEFNEVVCYGKVIGKV